MGISNISVQIDDNGGRRSGMERRNFSYSDHIPERRNGGDRRSGFDRRSLIDRRRKQDRRQESNEVINITDYIEKRKLKNRRVNEERRTAWMN